MKRFSLHQFYKDSAPTRFLDRIIITLLCLVILLVPLPFGSVELRSIFWLEIAAGLCFLLWITKLLFFGDPEYLSFFRQLQQEEKEQYLRAPFFHRHAFAGQVLRILTFGKWPRKYKATNLVMESDSEPRPQSNFYSVFGFPVRNTKIEFLALVLLGFLVFQVLPLPHFVSKILSPQTAHLYETAAGAAETKIGFHPISLDAFGSVSKLLEYLAYFFIYLVIMNGVPSNDYYRFVLVAVIGSAAFQGAYGLAEYFTKHQHIFAFKKIVNFDVATGTFINRNHYATYLEMSLPLLFGLIAGYLHQSSRGVRRSLKERIARVLENEGSKVLLLPVITLLIPVAIACSLSRSGILFTAVMVLMFFLLYSLLNKGLSTGLFILLVLFLIAAVTLGIIWEPLFARFAKISTEFTAERARLFLYRDTLLIFLDFPITGTGGGTFMQMFPMYRSFIANDVYRYAHNDYLQFLSEYGVVALFVFISLFLFIFRRLRQLLKRSISRILLIQLGAFCSLVTLGLHSLTDFGIQIPAIAVNGVVILALFGRTPGAEDKTI